MSSEGGMVQSTPGIWAHLPQWEQMGKQGKHIRGKRGVVLSVEHIQQNQHLDWLWLLICDDTTVTAERKDSVHVQD